jgi:hypothetical protein
MVDAPRGAFRHDGNQGETAVNQPDRHLIEGLAIHWAGRGLPVRARNALAYARCRTAEQVRALGRAYFAALENCGAVTLGQIEGAVGGWTEAESRNEDQLLPRHGGDGDALQEQHGDRQRRAEPALHLP